MNIYGHDRHYLKLQVKELPCYEHQIRPNKKRKLTELSIEEKLDMYDDLKVKKDYHENICARYQIGHESIKSLLKNMRKDSSYLKKQYE